MKYIFLVSNIRHKDFFPSSLRNAETTPPGFLNRYLDQLQIKSPNYIFSLDNIVMFGAVPDQNLNKSCHTFTESAYWAHPVRVAMSMCLSAVCPCHRKTPTSLCHRKLWLKMYSLSWHVIKQLKNKCILYPEIGKMCDVGPQTIKKQCFGVMENIFLILPCDHIIFGKKVHSFFPRDFTNLQFWTPLPEKNVWNPAKGNLNK